MTAKELVLLAKDKFEAITQNRNKELIHKSTQTQSEFEGNNDSAGLKEDLFSAENNDRQAYDNQYKTAGIASLRAPNDKIPGSLLQKVKTNKKRRIKWLPY